LISEFSKLHYLPLGIALVTVCWVYTGRIFSPHFNAVLVLFSNAQSHWTQSLSFPPLPNPASNPAMPSNPTSARFCVNIFLANRAMSKNQAKVTHKIGA
jgi:hypothetical protein